MGVEQKVFDFNCQNSSSRTERTTCLRQLKSYYNFKVILTWISLETSKSLETYSQFDLGGLKGV